MGKVDLDTCDREPIHLIGEVQPHGTLIAVNEKSLVVEYASANTEAFLNVAPKTLLGSAISALIGEENAAILPEVAVDPSAPDLLKPWFIQVSDRAGSKIDVECLPHRMNGHFILEFLRTEKSPAPVWEDEHLRRGFIAELVKPDALKELSDASAKIIREVTGFDRVMIYRFAEDKHGEVIAESTNRPDSFLGLHYPASDIPDPARRHFLLNVMRSIPDINAERVPIFGRSGAVANADSEQPLDLTYSKLRAVAPVHVEYLNNMGVRASLSISLITNNQLWGLVACHHYEPRAISSSRLRFVELIGGTTSVLLQSIENTNQLLKSIDAEKLAFGIEQQARGGARLSDCIRRRSEALMSLFEAQGALLVLDGEAFEFGSVPARTLDFSRMRPFLTDGVATSSALSTVIEMNKEQREKAAGAALLDLSEDNSDYLVLLRTPFDQTINWAGKPEKFETRTEDGVTRLSPRGSFALWREERLGQSRPFDLRDRDALRILRRALFALNSLERERKALKAKEIAESEEIRLRQSLLDAARASSMGELASAIAHELNQPLSAISNYLNACQQEFRNVGVEVPERAGELLNEAVAETERAGDLVRRVRDFVSRGDLNGELIDLNAAIQQGVDLALVSNPLPMLRVNLLLDRSLPSLWADPVQIGQVVLNLVRNSITAMENAPRQVLTIEVSRRDNRVRVNVRDTGCGITEDRMKYLFEPFHASTTHGMGFGLSLCRSIVEAHAGTIWAEPAAHGAVMVFELPIRGAFND